MVMMRDGRGCIYGFEGAKRRGYAYLFEDIAGVGLLAYVRGAGSDSLNPIFMVLR